MCSRLQSPELLSAGVSCPHLWYFDLWLGEDYSSQLKRLLTFIANKNQRPVLSCSIVISIVNYCLHFTASKEHRTSHTSAVLHVYRFCWADFSYLHSNRVCVCTPLFLYLEINALDYTTASLRTSRPTSSKQR